MKLAGAILIVFAAATTVAETDRELAFIGQRGKYWAFQKVVRSEIPAINDSWIRTPIDAFIFQSLRAKQLTPSTELEKAQLLRRVTYDLTGLPVAPEDLAAFLQDTSTSAYEKVVDRLLESPHYGERWALKWLDTVRFADTNGYELDADRPHAWRYRDYVIQSFNADKPFHRFIREQIAGDEAFPDNTEALIATGYLRAGSEHLVSGNIDPEESRQEVLTEIATNIGQTFLGMTVNCARCHNHKFDPISQADFYRLQAVFAAAKGKDVEIAAEAEKAQWEAKSKAYKEQLEPIEKALKELASPYEEQIKADRRAKLSSELMAALSTPKDKRNPEQQRLAKDAEAQINPDWDEVVEAMPPDIRARRAELRKKLVEVRFREPDPCPTAYAFVNESKEAPTTHILAMGDPHRKLDPINPGVPRVIQANFVVPTAATGRRDALASWLASPENPLTARVMVNRIWQFRMGSGLVRTLNDFGVTGDKPVQRELLDWLASEFVARGMSIKSMDRLIVTSSVYRQTSVPDEPKSKIDPDNRYFWRMNRKRMEAEGIRDSTLFISGSLNPQLGGRPVRIPIEPEVYDLIFTEHERDGLWPVDADKSIQNRRGIYLYNKRSVRLPLLSAFDQPDTITSCPVRPTSTHALQALSLFNSAYMQDVSRDFAARLTGACGRNQDCLVTTAWQLALARRPRNEERQLARRFLQRGGTLPDFCLALFNRNEFLYVP